jgi:hypothetical protein
MMDTGTAIIGTGVIVGMGQWAKGDSISIRTFVGVGVLAISLALIQSMNQPFAEQWGLLVFIASLMYYLVPITKALGFSK